MANETTSMKIHYKTIVKKFHADKPPEEGHEPYEIVTSEGIVNNEPPYETQVIGHTVEALGTAPAEEGRSVELPAAEEGSAAPSDAL